MRHSKECKNCSTNLNTKYELSKKLCFHCIAEPKLSAQYTKLRRDLGALNLLHQIFYK